MLKTVIIASGGSGTRMGSDCPKQFLPLNNQSVLSHSLAAFYEYDNEIEIILALPKDHISYWEELCREENITIPHRVVAGGETRFHSVKNALEKASRKGAIAIHDGARPLVSKKLITQLFDMVKHVQAVAPTLPVTDSLRQQQGAQYRVLDRESILRIQTPQVFQATVLHRAYLQNFHPSFTDDMSVVEKSGGVLHFIEGDERNIKITVPSDIEIAKVLMR